MPDNDFKSQVDDMLAKVWGVECYKHAAKVDPNVFTGPIHLTAEAEKRIEVEAAAIRRRVYGDLDDKS